MAFLLTSSPASVLAQDQQPVSIRQFGVGNTWRSGEMTGLLIELAGRDGVEEQVLVEWDLPTPDGDTARYSRVIAMSQGQPRELWLYGIVPHDTIPSTPMQVRVSTVEGGEPGDVLASHRFMPRVAGGLHLEPSTALIGVVGSQRAGLDQYINPSGNINQRPFSANEATAIASIADATLLPDKWEGLLPYEALVWTDAAPDLRPSQETALRDWIRRGGHLVIILPASGNPWNIGSSEHGPLGDLMPEPPRRDDQVSLTDILPSLMKDPGSTGSARTMPVRVFRDMKSGFNSLPADGTWESVHAMKDGRIWGIQQPVEHGRLTLLGLDLTAEQLRMAALEQASRKKTRAKLPEADVVWNRILGRRSDTPGADVLGVMEEEEVLNMKAPTDVRHVADTLASEPLSMSEEAGSGLLLVFGFFSLYWLVAVPGLWFFLARRNKQDWNWGAFSLAACVFAVLGWLIVEGMLDRSLRIRHVTVLDHVFNAEGQHARSWLSIYLPGYGERTLELDQESGTRNLLHPWSSESGDQSPYPDSTAILVDLDRRPDRTVVPGRGTSTTLHADWYGLVDDARWGGLLRIDPDDPVELQRDGLGNDIGLKGTIVNQLPGELDNVTITWMTGERLPPRRLAVKDRKKLPWVDELHAGKPLNKGYMWTKAFVAPGGHINLSDLPITPAYSLHDSIKKEYAPSESQGRRRKVSYNEQERMQALELLGFYHQLPPPAYHRTGDDVTRTGMTSRQFGRTLDLSPWLSRPCLIITGFLSDSRLPVPLVIDGDTDAFESSGLTMVRWILPLPQHDAAAFDL